MILKGLDSRLRGNDRVVVRARFWMTPAYDMRGQACRVGGVSKEKSRIEGSGS